MSLLQQIQTKAVDSSTDPADLLRLCLILAERVSYLPLKKWAENELSGYQRDEDVPSYRHLTRGFVYGDLYGWGGSSIKNTLIPNSIIPERIRSLVTETYVKEGIKHLENLLKKGPDAPLCRLWPADALRVVEVKKHFRDDFVLTRAWTAIDQGSIVGIIDNVRNNVLKFALEVEKTNSKAGEAEFGSHPVPADKMTQIFNTTINGSVGNFASGSNFQQISTSASSLRQQLEELGLDAKEIERLEVAIKEDGGKSPGAKVKKWLGELAGKAIDGLLPAGIDVIQKAILHHYNLS